jgi:hypothetical protein
MTTAEQITQITTHIIAKGKSASEILEADVLDALTYAKNYSRNNFTTFETELPHELVLAIYGIYRQIAAGSSNMWSGGEVSYGGSTFKADNDIPYSARKILENYRPKGFL